MLIIIYNFLNFCVNKYYKLQFFTKVFTPFCKKYIIKYKYYIIYKPFMLMNLYIELFLNKN